jgi:hypothetical protein
MAPITAATDAVDAALAGWDPASVPPDLRDEKTLDDVVISTEARRPETDPTLGRPVPPPDVDTSAHRLVVLGDSLGHGCQSDAIFNTDWSFPAIIARELGWYDAFRHPEYRGYGGLPLNLEYVVREVELRYGPVLNWWELGSAGFFVYHLLTQIRDYWEHGPGSRVPNTVGIMHNLAIAGYDVRDVLSQTADLERKATQAPTDPLLKPLVENAGHLLARYVLESARDGARALSPVEAAAALARDGGVETLIVFIGSNNALRTVVDLQVRWSGDGFDDLARKGAYNLWRPRHFALELDRLAEAVEAVGARHVIWATVPHVTIAPIARGIGGKVRPGSRYFPYYTRPWIEDGAFDPSADPYITANEARAIDSAIDQCNDAIAAVVRYGRDKQLDWLLMDTAGLLDRVASRRYLRDPAARPSWWTPYQLPAPVAALNPRPDSRFFASDASGRTQGGLFSLDGVHGTTITYAILAQEFINVMVSAGVTFYQADKKTPRTGPIVIDFVKMIARDSLISDPPKSLTSDLRSLGWLNELLDWVKRLGHIL